MFSDEQLDELYDSIEDHLERRSYTELDCIFQQGPASLHTDEILGYLIGTVIVASELPHREGFFREAEVVIRERGEYEKGLLYGLEGTVEQERRAREARKILNLAIYGAEKN